MLDNPIRRAAVHAVKQTFARYGSALTTAQEERISLAVAAAIVAALDERDRVGGLAAAQQSPLASGQS